MVTASTRGFAMTPMDNLEETNSYFLIVISSKDIPSQQVGPFTRREHAYDILGELPLIANILLKTAELESFQAILTEVIPSGTDFEILRICDSLTHIY